MDPYLDKLSETLLEFLPLYRDEIQKRVDVASGEFMQEHVTRVRIWKRKIEEIDELIEFVEDGELL